MRRSLHRTAGRAAAKLACAISLAIAASAAQAHAQDPFTRCLASLRTMRAARAVRPETWDRLVTPLRPDSSVLAALNAQPEFTLPVWDYFAIMVDAERITDGQRLLHEHASLLARIADRYGVDAATVVAIWGIESDFGANLGDLPVLRSLATLSCIGRRQAYFRTELFAALRVVQAGHIQATRLNGSWAGAFGQTQFMPGTFEWLAVDFDGDGRRDVIDNISDALGSAAHFLQRAGRWRAGEPWGVEVRLPSGLDVTREGRAVQRPLSTWTRRGVVRADGTPLVRDRLAATTTAALLTPAGPRGPSFLVFRNYRAIIRYNASDRYALAILHLADRLRGGGPLATPWPTDDPGLSRADRRELHALLAARGHAVGRSTAVLTPAIIAAVIAEQQRLGHDATGRPGQRLLGALRNR